MNVASSLETGIERLFSGDSIILFTDGVVGDNFKEQENIRKELENIFSKNDIIEMQIENCIKFALKQQRIGRILGDNIACAVLQVY